MRLGHYLSQVHGRFGVRNSRYRKAGRGVGLTQVKVAGFDLAWPRVVEIYSFIPSNTLLL